MRFRAHRLRMPCPRPSPGHTGRGSKTAVALLALASLARAAGPVPPPSPIDVDAAITKGKAFLYSLQNADGTWETDPAPPAGPLKKPSADPNASADNNQYGGKTALAVYALLEAGDNGTDDRLKKAVAFLQKTASVSTYTLSLKCLCWSDLPATNDVKQALRRDAMALLGQKKMAGPNLVWDYALFAPARKNYYTLTSTQAAAWGLYAATEADYEVPADTWKLIEKTFEAGQQADGGWAYLIAAKGTAPKPPSMYNTATGVSALYLAQDYTRADAFASPHGNAVNPAIDKGLAWITRNIDQQQAGEKSGESAHRRLYGIEHVGLISGLRKFGTHDWYAEGADYFLKIQNRKDGSFGVKSGTGDYRLTDTAWAVLFLQRGRTPVAINKLDYSPAAASPKKALWDQRPRDAANAVAWVERALERELRWQIVDTNDAVTSMLEAPVLYLSGGDAVDLKPEARAKLKQYVEQGGLILANADGGNAAFAKSVEKLGAELVPNAEWRDLPDTHPIFSAEVFRKEKFAKRPAVRAIGNGVREFVLLVPAADPAKTFQLKSARANGDAWQLITDVLGYATDKSNFYARGTTWLAADTAAKPKRTIEVARLQYNGAWDPEPAAWPQFGKFAAARAIGIKATPLPAGQAVPTGARVVYVSGAAAFTLDDATRKNLKTFMDGGGLVFFEAAGGNPAFAASAQGRVDPLVRGRRAQNPAAQPWPVRRRQNPDRLPPVRVVRRRPGRRATTPRRGTERRSRRHSQPRRPVRRPSRRADRRHRRLHPGVGAVAALTRAGEFAVGRGQKAEKAIFAIRPSFTATGLAPSAAGPSRRWRTTAGTPTRRPSVAENTIGPRARFFRAAARSSRGGRTARRPPAPAAAPRGRSARGRRRRGRGKTASTVSLGEIRRVAVPGDRVLEEPQLLVPVQVATERQRDVLPDLGGLAGVVVAVPLGVLRQPGVVRLGVPDLGHRRIGLQRRHVGPS